MLKSLVIFGDFPSFHFCLNLSLLSVLVFHLLFDFFPSKCTHLPSPTSLLPLEVWNAPRLSSAMALISLKVKVLQFLWLALYSVILLVSLKMPMLLLLHWEAMSWGCESFWWHQKCPRHPQKEGERWEPANLPAPTAAPSPQKCSQGTSALPHGFAEVGASSSSSLSQQIKPSPVPQFTA